MFGTTAFGTLRPFGALPANASILLAADAVGSGTASASLTTSIQLYSDAIGTGVATAALTAGNPGAIYADAIGSGAATAAMTTSIRMAANASSGGYVFAALTAGFDSPASQVYGSGRGGVTVEEVMRQWDWLEARQAEQKARQAKLAEPKPAPKPKAQKAPAPAQAPAGYNAAQVLRSLLGSK